jgi:adenylate kinase
VIIAAFGAPGTGKSTHARYMAAKLGLPWISTGAVLREVARQDERIARIMAAGDLVPSEVVDAIMRQRLADIEGGFVVDGYPRMVPEAESFIEFLRERSWRLDRVYHFVVPDDVIVERLMVRGREDDTPAAIRERLKVYRLETEPVLDLVGKSGAEIIEVDNSRPIEVVQQELDASIEELAGRLETSG